MAGGNGSKYLGRLKVRRNRNGWGKYEYLIKIPAGYIHRYGVPQYVDVFNEDGMLIIIPASEDNNT